MTGRLVCESRWPPPSLGLQGFPDLLTEGGKVFRLALKLCGFFDHFREFLLPLHELILCVRRCRGSILERNLQPVEFIFCEDLLGASHSRLLDLRLCFVIPIKNGPS